ncbi:MAG: DegV family protein [Christensenellales bacterium]
MIHITSDSTTDLGELYERRGIEKLPLAVVLGSDTYEDGVTVHPSDIYDFVEKTKYCLKPRRARSKNTANSSPRFLNSDDDSIVHFTISSKLSVTYQNALAASKDFKTFTSSIRNRFPRAVVCSPLRVRSSRRGQIHRERNLRKVSRPRSRRRSVFLRGYDGLPV